MTILDCKVEWREEWDNTPELFILVDEFPSLEKTLFDYKPKGLFFAEEGDFVLFFYYVRPSQGFGGRSFTLNMKDGTKKTLVGPWSSRSGVMNDAGFTKCVEVVMTNSRENFKDGLPTLSGAIALSSAMKAVEEFLPDVTIIRAPGNEEEFYIPALKDGRLKPNPKTYHGKLKNYWR
jgi:hypothetical protein